MSTTSKPIVSFKERQSHTRCTLTRLMALSLIGSLTASQSFAGDGWWPVPIKQRSLPESILIPLSHNGQKMPNGGWILSYRNGLQGPEAPDREVQIREVTFGDGALASISSEISWEILRIRNDECVEDGEDPCPDRIRVLSVPEGFMAVPEDIWIGEGRSIRIFIVPEGIG